MEMVREAKRPRQAGRKTDFNPRMIRFLAPFCPPVRPSGHEGFNYIEFPLVSDHSVTPYLSALFSALYSFRTWHDQVDGSSDFFSISLLTAYFQRKRLYRLFNDLHEKSVVRKRNEFSKK